MVAPPQALVRIVPNGGARTARQLFNQWTYLSREGQVVLERSRRHLGVVLPTASLEETARSWIAQTGIYEISHIPEPSAPDLTTHIVVSFPPGTDLARAFAAGRDWANEMFGSGRHGGSFDYLTACHSDRPHPHIHVVINRRALEGHWLKISRRNLELNYTTMRSMLVIIAARHDIVLDASSRVERNIFERPITYAEFRRRARQESKGGGDSVSRAGQTP